MAQKGLKKVKKTILKLEKAFLKPSSLISVPKKDKIDDA